MGCFLIQDEVQSSFDFLKVLDFLLERWVFLGCNDVTTMSFPLVFCSFEKCGKQ